MLAMSPGRSSKLSGLHFQLPPTIGRRALDCEVLAALAEIPGAAVPSPTATDTAFSSSTMSQLPDHPAGSTSVSPAAQRYAVPSALVTKATPSSTWSAWIVGSACCCFVPGGALHTETDVPPTLYATLCDGPLATSRLNQPEVCAGAIGVVTTAAVEAPLTSGWACVTHTLCSVSVDVTSQRPLQPRGSVTRSPAPKRCRVPSSSSTEPSPFST
mmetsp:Transcript_3373/g.13613  ORF Transcript_3373/g.13613 Transcript_3373/m.13613 type:complete len:214 (-) Transcript_3373:300-941(-)